jgi:hypothetical protein
MKWFMLLLALVVGSLGSVSHAQMGMPAPGYWEAYSAAARCADAERERDMAYNYMVAMFRMSGVVLESSNLQRKAGDSATATADIESGQGDWYLIHGYFALAAKRYITAELWYRVAADCYRKAASRVFT